MNLLQIYCGAAANLWQEARIFPGESLPATPEVSFGVHTYVHAG
jgi:hypothetical protein